VSALYKYGKCGWLAFNDEGRYEWPFLPSTISSASLFEKDEKGGRTSPRPPTLLVFALHSELLLGEVFLRLRQGERAEVQPEVQPEVETLPLAAGHPQSGKRKFPRDLFDKDADKINCGAETWPSTTTYRQAPSSSRRCFCQREPSYFEVAAAKLLRSHGDGKGAEDQ
jgi:hypothetical protein